MTPFQIVYGREPPLLHPFVHGETKIAELEQQLVERDQMLEVLRSNLMKAQSRMKSQADSKRRDLSFNVGDVVFLRLRPYRQKSLAKRLNEKLSPRYFGPYKIVRQVGPVSYELQLPETSKVHPIFHVSLLRPARGCSDIASPPPLPLSGELEFMVEPEKVLSHRWVKESGVPTLELLIQWRRCPVEEASWEDYDLLAVQFPLFCLEDKASFQGGCTDTNPPLKTYFRRKYRQKNKELNSGQTTATAVV